MDTTYLFSGVRIKDAPPSLDHLGFGLATDNLGSQASDDYLTVVDPYNTETQVRVAEITGTVLIPTEGVRSLLGQIYRFTPDDVEETLERPSVFYEDLLDDEAQLLNMGDLVPTISDPTPKLQGFYGEVVSIQGVALGEMIRTEDIPKLRDLPVHLTVKSIGIVDLSGAMPIFGISSEDVTGEVFGFFRFELSVYRFDAGGTYAFMIGQEAVVLDPITEITRAELGDIVAVSLVNYVVLETEAMQLASDLTLAPLDLLVPTSGEGPIIMTRHPDLTLGAFVSDADVSGYLVDGRLLGIPADLLTEHGVEVIVVDTDNIRFVLGQPFTATPVPTPTLPPTPTLQPTHSLVR